MKKYQLEQILNSKLDPKRIKDYTYNGLQIEGKEIINKIVVGVTASQALINFAIEVGADAILVHHGYFWPSETNYIRGIKYQRIAKLIKHDINLYAYHLPVDLHPELGNNIQICNLLYLKNITQSDIEPLIFHGQFTSQFHDQNNLNSAREIKHKLEKMVGHDVTYVGIGLDHPIKSIAVCSGGGQNFIDTAYLDGADCYISGEISEQTTHTAVEEGKHYFAIGHHSSEVFGIKAVGEWLANEHGLEIIFKDIFNPA